MEFNYFEISWVMTYILGTICGITILSRFIRMFPVYIKTGSLGNSSNGIFFYNRKYDKKTFMETVKGKAHDFFIETHLETILMDLLVVTFAIVIIHIAWIVLLGVAAIIAIIYGIVQFVKHLRARYIKKEEFYTALKGE